MLALAVVLIRVCSAGTLVRTAGDSVARHAMSQLVCMLRRALLEVDQFLRQFAISCHCWLLVYVLSLLVASLCPVTVGC